MARLFTFGCSLTSYVWPTWSNILATHPHFDTFENWALPGIGNFAIFERLVECITTRNLQPSDIVVVQWSGVHRHDILLTSKGWIPQGASEILNNDWYEKAFDSKAYCFHTLNYIIAAQTLLNNSSCIWRMTSMNNLVLTLDSIMDTPLAEIDTAWTPYKTVIDKDHWVQHIGFNADGYADSHQWFDPATDKLPWADQHCTPAQSWQWATSNLLPSLGLSETLHQQELVVEVESFSKKLKKLNQAYLENTQQFEWFAKQQTNIGYPHSK